MTEQNTLHLCPSPECAARGHQPVYTPPTYPASPNPAAPWNPLPQTFLPLPTPNPLTTGMFWTHEQLASLMDEVRKHERATVLAEIELLKLHPATED